MTHCRVCDRCGRASRSTEIPMVSLEATIYFRSETRPSSQKIGLDLCSECWNKWFLAGLSEFIQSKWSVSE